MVISLDGLKAESRYQLEPAHNLTPEKLFERQWAIAVLDQVLARLETEFAADGKQAIFDRLKPFLTAGRQAGGHAEAAAGLGMTEGRRQNGRPPPPPPLPPTAARGNRPNRRQPRRNRRRNPVFVTCL